MAMPQLRKTSSFCDRCKGLDFWSFRFSITYNVPDLAKYAKGSCDLCRLFWNACQTGKADKFATVRFERIGSWLRMNGSGAPAFSIFQAPSTEGRADVQIGFPNLPEAGGKLQFEVLKQWLSVCDDERQHPKCAASVSSGPPTAKRLPTRLIAVGKEDDEVVRVHGTVATDVGRYAALSHQWGPPPHFMTDVDNLETLKTGIELRKLPATFRDAVLVTRALGLPYLWIDSLCIIQGDGGDFKDEAKRMHSVFNSAYVVIAASRAACHIDGFLQSRREREYVVREEGGGDPFYLCENIDNFNSHVLEGALNKRGWVYQEHALARRTVFFTETQMYWECGDGVRCETMTKMKNDKSAFLGDANFPNIVLGTTRGEKILRFQNLFKTYCQLNLTRDYDRPIAIDGLQSRLLTAFETPGGFGVLDDGGGLLRRSLLWHRALKEHGNEKLARIDFPADRNMSVPSWSWMACNGEIDYLQPSFAGMDWEEVWSPDWEELWSPWTKRTPSNDRTNAVGGLAELIKVQVTQSLVSPMMTTSRAGMALVAPARDINPGGTANQEEGQVIWDDPTTMLMGESARRKYQGVVLGVGKERYRDESLESRMHYLLVVEPTGVTGRDGLGIFERIGAGYLLGRFIGAEKTAVKIQ